MDDFTPQRIKQIRKELRLTQAQFAAKIGCSKQTVSYWEQGRRTPGGTAATAIRYLIASSKLAEINTDETPDREVF